MSTLVRWNPRRELEPFTRDPFFRHFFDLFEEGMDNEGSWLPSMDLTEEPDRLVLRLELPGIDPKDVELSVQGDTVTVRGERRQENNSDDAKVLRREHNYGVFERTVRLPYTVQADKVKAQAKNGVMTITLPKAQEHVGRKIPIEMS